MKRFIEWLLMGIAILLIYNIAVCRADTNIPILCYHHIANGVRSDYFLDPMVFKSHLDYLQSHGYHTVTFAEVASGNPLPTKPIILTFDDGYKDHFTTYQALRDRGMKGTFFIITSYIGHKGYLSKEQIQLMSMMGMEIGSHTVSHPYLTRLKQGEMFCEIHMSRRALEDMLGQRVLVMAYPYGAYNKNVIDVMELAGYWYGRTTDERIGGWGQKKNYKLPVVLIHHGTKSLKGVLE